MTPAPSLTFREHAAFLWRCWRPNRGFLGLLLFFTIVSTMVTIAYPLVFKEVIDTLRAGDATIDLGRLLGILAAIALGRVVAGLYPGIRAWVNQRIERAVRERTFGAILEKDHTFRARFRTGDLVTRLTDDVAEYPRIAWFACSGLFRFFDSMSKFVFCVAAMLLLDVPLTLLAVLPVPVMLYVFYRIRRALGETYERQQRAVAETNDLLESAFSGIRIVKAFNAGPGQEKRLGGVLRERIGIQLKLAKLHVLMHQVDDVAGRAGQVVVMAIGGYRVLEGTLSLGTLYALYLYLDLLVHPMIDLPNLFATARQAFVSIDRVEEVLRHPGVRPTGGDVEGPERIDRIGFDGVGFSYGEGRAAALSDVTFTVERGRRVAVVGGVGSGKSTLLRLLAGLSPPAAGAIEINGRPAGAWRWETLRSRIGYVPQDAQLFSDPIGANVAFGRDGDEAWLRRCLDVAQMTPDLEAMPLGLDTRLGRGGTRISGGQRQRIAIARALAGRPDLLLLDDCTASLDAENEERFWRSLGATFPGTTAFIVSHRLATIRQADLVLVLEDGRLVDQGAHEALARRCAIYQTFLMTEEKRRHLDAMA